MRTEPFGNRHRHKGYLLKSNAEYSFALLLDKLMDAGEITEWLYEPQTFWFEGIQRGTVSYKPDFKVVWAGDADYNRLEQLCISVHIYYEVKRGKIEQKDITKYKRMAKYYPDVKLVLVFQGKTAGNGKWAIRTRILLSSAQKYVNHIWYVDEDYKRLGIKTKF